MLIVMSLADYYSQRKPADSEIAELRTEMQLYLDRSGDIYRSTGGEIAAIGGQSVIDSRSGRVSDQRGGNISQLQKQQTLPCIIAVLPTTPIEVSPTGDQPQEVNRFQISFPWDSDVRVRDRIVESNNSYIVEDTDAGDSYRLLLNCMCRRVI